MNKQFGRVDRAFYDPYPLTAMLFNVAGLIQEGIGATRWHQVSDEFINDEQESEPVSGEIEFLRTKAGVLVRAHLQLEEPETCSRCLRPVDETVRIDFEEEFLTRADAQLGDPDPEADNAEAFLIEDDNQLDISEAVRQYREASVVMQPLCSPNCLGLCPRCGLDRNQGQCGCDTGPIDDRWAALQGLLREDEGRN